MSHKGFLIPTTKPYPRMILTDREESDKLTWSQKLKLLVKVSI